MAFVLRIERICTLATPMTARRGERFRVASHPGHTAGSDAVRPRCTEKANTTPLAARTQP